MTTTPAAPWPDESSRTFPAPAHVGPLFVATWGKIRLFASAFHTDNSRTQVVHDLSSGDIHPVQDRGLRARRVRVSLLFDDFTGAGQGEPMESFRAFKAAVDSGARAIFTHPVEGSYLACVGEFTYELDENSNISNAIAEFIAEEEIRPTEPNGTTSGIAGESYVVQAADNADAEMAKAGLAMISPALMAEPNLPDAARRRLAINASLDLSASASEGASVSLSLGATVPLGAPLNVNAGAGLRAEVSTPSVAVRLSASASAAVASEVSSGVFAGLTTDATTAVASWSEGVDTPLRQVTNDVARISTNITTAIEVGGFERDLQLWPVFRALILLGESVRAAAVAATSETPSVFLMRVTSPTALLPLAARVYGGADARERERQIMALNDIRSPCWLDPGDYLMPARSSAQRSPF